MHTGTSLNGAVSAAVGSLTSATRYRPESTAANSAGLWQVRDLQSGLRRWLRYLDGGSDAGPMAAMAQAVHARFANQPWLLALERADTVQDQPVLVHRWLGETPLTSEKLNGRGVHYALQLLDAIHALTTTGEAFALPAFDLEQVVVMAAAQRLRLSDMTRAQATPSAEALAATRSAVRRVLADLIPENSAASRYTDLASAWENDAAVYPDLRLALAQLQYGQLLSQ